MTKTAILKFFFMVLGIIFLISQNFESLGAVPTTTKGAYRNGAMAVTL